MKPEGGCCDLATIRRYARTSWRWVDAYRCALDGVLASWAVRQSKCHRCVTDAADREVERLAAAKEKSAAVRVPPGSRRHPLSLGCLLTRRRSACSSAAMPTHEGTGNRGRGCGQPCVRVCCALFLTRAGAERNPQCTRDAPL